MKWKSFLINIPTYLISPIRTSYDHIVCVVRNQATCFFLPKWNLFFLPTGILKVYVPHTNDRTKFRCKNEFLPAGSICCVHKTHPVALRFRLDIFLIYTCEAFHSHSCHQNLKHGGHHCHRTFADPYCRF